MSNCNSIIFCFEARWSKIMNSKRNFEQDKVVDMKTWSFLSKIKILNSLLTVDKIIT